MKKLTRGGLIGVILGWAGRLRFPALFFVAATLFVFDLFIPDVVPLADELLLGLGALLLANLKRKAPSSESEEVLEGGSGDSAER